MNWKEELFIFWDVAIIIASVIVGIMLLFSGSLGAAWIGLLLISVPVRLYVQEKWWNHL